MVVVVAMVVVVVVVDVVVVEVFVIAAVSFQCEVSEAFSVHRSVPGSSSSSR